MLVDSGSYISLIYTRKCCNGIFQTDWKSPKRTSVNISWRKRDTCYRMYHTSIVSGKAGSQSQLRGGTLLNFSGDPGIDFLQKYTLLLNFISTPVSVTSKPVDGLETLPKSMKPIVHTSKKAKICAVQAFEKAAGEPIVVQFYYLVRSHHLSLMFPHILIDGNTRTAQEVVHYHTRSYGTSRTLHSNNWNTCESTIM